MKLTTSRLLLRSPHESDAQLLLSFEKKNEKHFSLFTPCNHPLREEFFKQKLETFLQEENEGKALRFLVFLKDEKESPQIGVCNFTQIFRGPFQACYLGYKIDEDFEGKGLMFEALRASIDYIFSEINLHRIMANYVPHNFRSEKLLERLGFVKEGFAKNYLFINEGWEDHVLTSLTNPFWKKNPS